MRIPHIAIWTCALAILLSAGAATLARADAPPSASTAELKDALSKAPTTAALANGDPGGVLTGTVNDVPVADPKAGLTLSDVANQVGQNKIAINFVWTLVTGFLVMFMQAGFAMVEAGLCRVKNANHTYMMNFFVYACGLFAYWIIGFAIQMGGAAGNGNLGGLQSLNTEHLITIFGTHWGIFGECGMFLARSTYDVGVMVIFLFEMVFMDTALTIVTGACAERWKFLAFTVSSVLMGAFTYPLYGNWAWGGGWLSQLGTNLGLGKGYCDFAGSGVVHAVGGITALAVAMIIGPRIGKYQSRWLGKYDHRPRYFGGAHRLLHPRLRMVRIQPGQHIGRIRSRQLAHRLHRGQHNAGWLHRNLRRHSLYVGDERQA